MVKAFQASIENKHLMKNTNIKWLSSQERKSAKTTQADPAHPLVQALSVNNFGLGVCQQEVDYLQEFASHWGERLPPYMQRLMFEASMNRSHKALKESGEKAIKSYTTDKTVVKSSQDHPTREWKTLHPIGVEDLKLFQVATGGVLSGRLVTDPFATVGVTTFLEDSKGALVQLGLYNMLPGAPTGKKLLLMAEQRFPKGTKLSIAEPFYKIFRDGKRGVRVDDPPDVRVESGTSETD
eukprot:1638725-Amphidinium_carterae.1